MQLQNFECHIAKAQIGRYLAGDTLSDEAIEQLERHIDGCGDCKQNLAERRALLQAMLSKDEPAAAVVETPRKQTISELLRSKLPKPKMSQADTVKPGTFAKPALYSLALGAVLIGMSYASKNVGSMLGPKVTVQAAAHPAPPTAKVTVAAPRATITTPPFKMPDLSPVAHSIANAAAAKPGPAPQLIKNKPSNPKSPASIPAPHHRHRSPRHANEIRIYQPEN